MHDLGLEFEYFLRFTMLNALHPSPSKQVAVENNFFLFRGYRSTACKKGTRRFRKIYERT